MRQLLPRDAAGVDVESLYPAARRPPWPGRPWVVLGMIASVDGATAVAGRSGPLGGPGDKAVFRAVRAAADVVLVGAGTARTERYGPVRLGPDVQARRLAAGRPALPRLAVVTASGRLPDDLPLLAASPAHEDGAPSPIVLTVEDLDPGALRALAVRVEVRTHGRGRVDLAAALSGLAAEGVAVVVCEGGPSLNGSLLEAGLVDEICLTTAPALAGGASHRLVTGAREIVTPMTLDWLLEEDGMLFARYVRADVTP